MAAGGGGGDGGLEWRRWRSWRSLSTGAARDILGCERPAMILFLHNRYRTTGGEERVVDDLAWLVREQLGEPVRAAERATRTTAGSAGARRPVCCAAASAPAEVAAAVRGAARHAWCTRTTSSRRSAGARWRRHAPRARGSCCTCTSTGSCARSGSASRAGRSARAATGATRCPGVLRNCRGSRAQALAYGAGLALWQRRLAEQADAVIVPSVFARERLRALGAPLPWERVHVLAPPVRALADRPGVGTSGGRAADRSRRSAGRASLPVPVPGGPYALVRLAPEPGEGGRRGDRRLPAGGHRAGRGGRRRRARAALGERARGA